MVDIVGTVIVDILKCDRSRLDNMVNMIS